MKEKGEEKGARLLVRRTFASLTDKVTRFETERRLSRALSHGALTGKSGSPPLPERELWRSVGAMLWRTAAPQS